MLNTIAGQDRSVAGHLIQSADWRRTMGQFPSGVTIVTSRVGEEAVGTTVSAFSSLSLDPMLLIVCLDHNSQTRSAILRSGVFAVNILASGQQALALQFGRSKGGDKFSGIDFQTAETGSPLLPGACANIDCILERLIDGGDHDILIGRPRSLCINEDATPLIYHRGRFLE